MRFMIAVFQDAPWRPERVCSPVCHDSVPPCGHLCSAVHMHLFMCLLCSSTAMWWLRRACSGACCVPMPTLVAWTPIFIYMPCPSAETWWCGNTCHVSLPAHGGLACLFGCMPCPCSASCPSGHAFLPALPHDSMGRIIYILSGTQGQQI